MRPSSPKSPSLSKDAVRKGIFAGLAGLSLAGTVAGCAPSTADSTPGSAGARPAPSAGSSSLAASGTGYKEGTYSADGNYVSPNGTVCVSGSPASVAAIRRSARSAGSRRVRTDSFSGY